MTGQTKTAELIGYMRAEDWTRALSLAAKFRMLGRHRAAIHRAHQARQHPSFYRGMGRDPERLVAEGITALQLLYPERPTTGDTAP